MKYIDFYNKFKNYPVINLFDVRNVFPNFDHRRFYEWQKKDYIKKIINNYYFFANKKPGDNEKNFIANKLCEPSYISLEYALSYYALIPETVQWQTCVTTKKTRQFATPIGNFLYRKIKNESFFGYKIMKINNVAFKMAEPEKAILDFLYLRKDINDEKDFFELRLNYINISKLISKKKLREYARRFKSKKINNKIEILLSLITK